MSEATREVKFLFNADSATANTRALSKEMQSFENHLTRVAGSLVRLEGVTQKWVDLASGNSQLQVSRLSGLLDDGTRIILNYSDAVQSSTTYLDNFVKISYKAANAALAQRAAMLALRSVPANFTGTPMAAGTGTQAISQRLFQDWQLLNPAIAASVSGTKTVSKNVQSASIHTSSLLLSWHSLARLFTVQVFHRAFASLTSSLRDGISASLELQKAIGEIRSISQTLQADLTSEQWERGIFSIAKTWGVQWRDVAEGIYQATSNQVAFGEGALFFMNSAAKLSTSTVSTITESVNALSSVINAYSLHIGMADEISAKLFKTVELGRVRLKEMHSSMGDIVIMASQLGISFDEVLATVVTLTNQGMKFNRTATQLRGVMVKLIKPTEALQDLLAEGGFANAEDFTMLKGLTGTFKLFQDYAEGSTTALAKLMPLVRGLPLIISATSATGRRKYNTALDGMQDSMASFEAAVTRNMQTTAKEVEKLKAKFAELFISDYGGFFTDTFVKMSQSVKDLDVVVKILIDSIFMLSLALGGLKIATSSFAFLTKLTPAGRAAGLAFVALSGFFVQLARSRQVAITATKEALAVIDNANKELIENGLKTDAQLIKNVESTILQMRKIGIAATATYRREINAQYSTLDAELEFLGAEGKKAFDAIDKSIDKHLDSIDSAIDKYQDLQKEMTKAIGDSKFAAGQTLFSLSLEDKDLDKQYQLTITRLKQIGALADKANSFEAFQMYSQEQLSLIGQAHQLRRDILKNNKDVEESQKKQRDSLLEQNFELDVMHAKLKNIKDVEERREQLADIARKERDIAKSGKKDTGKTFAEPDFNAQSEYLKYYKNQEIRIMEMKRETHDKEMAQIQARNDLEISLLEYRINYEQMLRYDAKEAGKKLNTREDFDKEMQSREDAWRRYYESASAVGANIAPKQRETLMRTQAVERQGLERSFVSNVVDEQARLLKLSLDEATSAVQQLGEETGNLRAELTRHKTLVGTLEQDKYTNTKLANAIWYRQEADRARAEMEKYKGGITGVRGTGSQSFIKSPLDTATQTYHANIRSLNALGGNKFIEESAERLATARELVRDTQILLQQNEATGISLQKVIEERLEELKGNRELMDRYGITIGEISSGLEDVIAPADAAANAIGMFTRNLKTLTDFMKSPVSTPAPTSRNRPTSSNTTNNAVGNVNVTINGADDAVATNVVSTIRRAQYGGLLE